MKDGDVDWVEWMAPKHPNDQEGVPPLHRHHLHSSSSLPRGDQLLASKDLGLPDTLEGLDWLLHQPLLLPILALPRIPDCVHSPGSAQGHLDRNPPSIYLHHTNKLDRLLVAVEVHGYWYKYIPMTLPYRWLIDFGPYCEQRNSYSNSFHKSLRNM